MESEMQYKRKREKRLVTRFLSVYVFGEVISWIREKRAAQWKRKKWFRERQ